MRSDVCITDARACPNLRRASIMDQRWLDIIRQRIMQEIQSASDMKLGVPQTFILHLPLGEPRACVIFGVMKKLAVPELLRTTFIENVLKWIHPAEKMIVSYHSLPLPFQMVHVAKREAEKSTMDIRQINNQDPTMLVTPTSTEPRYTTIVRVVALKAICDTSVFVCKHAAHLIKEISL